MTGQRWWPAFLGALAMAGAVAAADALLQGEWGGDRLRIVIDASGASLETDCASGRITGPIKISPTGAFAADGTFERHLGGPQPAEPRGKPSTAHYSGEVKGDVMTLTVVPEGATAALRFSLRRGATVKILRCV